MNNLKTIFVVGSKPDAVFPDVRPDVVIAANGSIRLVQNFVGESQVVGIITNSILCDLSDATRKTVEILRGCYVDELNVVLFRPRERERFKANAVYSPGPPTPQRAHIRSAGRLLRDRARGAERS